jgi:hypothetical protein
LKCRVEVGGANKLVCSNTDLNMQISQNLVTYVSNREAVL